MCRLAVAGFNRAAVVEAGRRHRRAQDLRQDPLPR